MAIAKSRRNHRRPMPRALLVAALSIVPLIVLSVALEVVYSQATAIEALRKIGYVLTLSSFLLVPAVPLFLGSYILAFKLPLRHNRLKAVLAGVLAFLALGVVPLGISAWLGLHDAKIVDPSAAQASSVVSLILFWSIGSAICGASSVIADVLLVGPPSRGDGHTEKQ